MKADNFYETMKMKQWTVEEIKGGGDDNIGDFGW